MSANVATPSRRLVAGSTLVIVGLVLLVAPWSALAQPSPLSVNDCTLLPDPGALRRCLDQAEGRVVSPPPVSAPAASDRPKDTVPAADSALAKQPAAQQKSDFLTDRPGHGRQIPPASRNVIDLH